MNETTSLGPTPGRRAVCVLALSTPWLYAQGSPPRRVAWVSIDSPNPANRSLAALREALRGLGWTEGQNIVVDTWWAEGSADKLKALVPQILASRPDVIVATTGPAVRPFVDAQVAVPVVFAFSADPVQGQVVQSWARPGVNRTGVSYFSVELMPKRMQLMRELLPRMRRVAVVGWPPHAGELLELDAARQAAQAQGLTMKYWGAHTAADVDAALGAIDGWKPDAVLVFAGVVASSFPDRFAAWSLKRRIPTISAWGAFAEAGNLMTYGPVIGEAQARLAFFVDRILKGAKADDMPVELPLRIELVLNLKMARAIGVMVPRSMLQRADRVIE
ncbi:MAG TPA: ABC transporter substrate-binding protein [Rubrivivax sp.]|nr:ABC transporter substrate-binding protein [Rubrivivax sp.]